MTDKIVQLLDTTIESFPSEESGEKMDLDLSLLTQADPLFDDINDAETNDTTFLDNLFKRAEKIVQSGTPKKSSPTAGNSRKDLQISRIKHNLSKLAVEKAKSSRNLQNLQQQIRTGKCPISLRYRASPRLKRDEIFNASFTSLVKESQQKLLELICQQHERNIQITSSNMRKQFQELESLCRDKESLQKAFRDIEISIETGSAGKKPVKGKNKNTSGLCKTLRFRSKRPLDVKAVGSQKENKISEKYQRSLFIASKSSTQGRTFYKTNITLPPQNNPHEIQPKQSSRMIENIPSSLSQKRKARRQKHSLSTSSLGNAQFIRNLSDQSVSPSVINLVAKGLKFIPTPQKQLTIRSLLRDFKGFQNRMRWSYIFSHSESKPIHPFYMKTNRDADPVTSTKLESFLDNVHTDIAHLRFRRIRDNLCPEERNALETLATHKEIILKKADKGSTTVLMNRAGKVREGLDLLNNPLHYATLSEPIVESTHAKAMNIVSRLHANKHIDNTTSHFLRHVEGKHIRIPEFYTLTKIHKQPPVGRPITSGCGGPTERISQFVDWLLQPIAQIQNSYIKDTTDFINFIERTVVPKEALLVTMDVTSLYTNIPADEGIEFVTQSYTDFYKETPPIPVEYLKELLNLILKENSFRFDGQHYLQLHGVAMGTKTAVSFANIYMANLERKFLATSPVKPLHYKRFIDDIGSIFLCSREEMSRFETFLNAFHPTIKFTLNISDSQMIFLDTIIFKGPRFHDTGLLDVRTYFKPTETFQYTHFSSCHPASCKKGFVKGEALRYLRNNSVKDYFARDIANFKKRLVDRGYPATLVDPILDGVKFEERSRALTRSTRCTKNTRTPVLVTTYNPAVPPLKSIIMKHWHMIRDHDRLSRIFPEEPIVAYRREKSLSDRLVRAKL